jgi:hypothetical protein
VDNWRLVTADGATTLLDSFDTADTWAREDSIGGGRDVLSLGISADFASDGPDSLRLLLSGGFGTTNRPGVLYRPAPDAPLPVLVSPEWAAQVSPDEPLQPGDERSATFNIITDDVRDTERVEVAYRVVDVLAVPALPGEADAAVLVADLRGLQAQLNRRASLENFYDANTVYLALDDREPPEALRESLRDDASVSAAVFAWDRFNAIQRYPLANGITGMLLSGFWVSLFLIVLDFAFYLAITTRRRAVSFAVLQAMGWERRRIHGLLTVEQAAFITPALVVGVLLGLLVAVLVLPFLALVGQSALQIPVGQIAGLLLVLIAAFSLLIAGAARSLHRMAAASALRTE